MRAGLDVCVVPPRLKGPRWRRVTAAGEPLDGTGGQLVSLSGVGGLAASSELVGRTLLARVGDLPADLALHDAGALVGRAVVTPDGQSGTISEVMRGPAQDVWVVEGLPQGEALVPVVPAFEDGVPEEGPITVRLPGEGERP